MSHTQVLLSDSTIEEEKHQVAKLLIKEHALPLTIRQIINVHEKILKEYYKSTF